MKANQDGDCKHGILQGVPHTGALRLEEGLEVNDPENNMGVVKIRLPAPG